MKKLISAAAVALITVPGIAAADEEVPQETVDQIMAMLADMKCEMDPDDIEVEEDGGYDLDDVICQGEGQSDIKLDANLEIVSRRAE